MARNCEAAESAGGGSMTPLHAGAQLGPYVLVSQIGFGGMGEVWKAWDTRLGRTVAIKKVKEQHSKRFKQRYCISVAGRPDCRILKECECAYSTYRVLPASTAVLRQGSGTSNSLTFLGIARNIATASFLH